MKRRFINKTTGMGSIVQRCAFVMYPIGWLVTPICLPRLSSFGTGLSGHREILTQQAWLPRPNFQNTAVTPFPRRAALLSSTLVNLAHMRRTERRP